MLMAAKDEQLVAMLALWFNTKAPDVDPVNYDASTKRSQRTKAEMERGKRKSLLFGGCFGRRCAGSQRRTKRVPAKDSETSAIQSILRRKCKADYPC
jgi:hypothetical protein